MSRLAMAESANTGSIQLVEVMLVGYNTRGSCLTNTIPGFSVSEV